MRKITLICGILCVAIAVAVFIFADGLRRYYSGIFFAIMGAVMLVNACRWRRGADK